MEVNCFNSSLFHKESRFLLVIAHPDDEALFFSPFLTKCKAINRPVFILCLSEGDYYGQGKIRRREMVQSASIYGISSNQVQIIDDPELQDGPSNNWCPETVAGYVSKAINYLKPTVVLTFDEYGVSGHRNHTDTCRGVKFAMSQRRKRSNSIETKNNCSPLYYREDEDPITLLLLESTNIFRKFIGFFDIFLSCVYSERLVFNMNLAIVFMALFMHATQLVWFRFLFVLFSRYSYINTFCQYNCKSNGNGQLFDDR